MITDVYGKTKENITIMCVGDDVLTQGSKLVSTPDVTDPFPHFITFILHIVIRSSSVLNKECYGAGISWFSLQLQTKSYLK